MCLLWRGVAQSSHVQRRVVFGLRRYTCGVRGPALDINDNTTILGVESSADDSAVAVLDCKGNVLGESLISQFKEHRNYGGIWPMRARAQHQANLPIATEEALQRAGKCLQDISVIAFTIGPGLAPCLDAGLDWTCELAGRGGIPLLPVHHMHAHALTARMMADNDIVFPFMVLLVSGGHCTFAVAEDVSTFKILGSRRENQNPGVVLDKIAYLLRLHKVPSLEHLVPGAAIERAAVGGDPARYRFPWLRKHNQECNTTFSCYVPRLKQYLVDSDVHSDPDQPTPSYEDYAASVQAHLMTYITTKAERAALYTAEHYPDVRHFVVSGGVASNQLLRSNLRAMLARRGLRWSLVAPPSRLCTDNGVMIAWAGLEYLRQGISPLAQCDRDALRYDPKLSIGEDLSRLVVESKISVPLPT